MIYFHRTWKLALIAIFIGCATQTEVREFTAPTQDTVPLIHAHAHNDYMHQHPLFDALQHGFTSIEADIHLVNDDLLVAHDRVNVTSERTLKSLYLEPLKEIIESQNGWVYGDSTQITLLIDIKSEAESTYQRLHAQLEEYETIVTSFRDNKRHDKAVVIIVSGNRPLEYMQNQESRLAAYDGRISDLEKGYHPTLVPLISDRWSSQFDWKGNGVIPVEEEIKLLKILTQAHENGQRVRFWATPDYPSEERQRVWNTLYTSGVDLINTDDLEGLQSFLLDQMQSQ
jgi:glycerophosphoryl diester phosphodiesterase